VAEATISKQADLWQFYSMNIDTIPNRVFYENQNEPNMPVKGLIG
jgi:hypothetical protein